METILRRTGVVVGLVLLVVLASWLPWRGKDVDSLDIRTDGVLPTADSAGSGDPFADSRSGGPVGGLGVASGSTTPSPSASAGGAPTAGVTETPGARPPAPGGADSGLMRQVVSLVNQARSGAGCGAVTHDSRLAAAAQGHASDMARRGYFSHNSPEGVSPARRVDAAGYPGGWSGENIARDFYDAESVMESWMESPTNRAIILNCDAREVGMGLARDSVGSPFWAQMFGTG